MPPPSNRWTVRPHGPLVEIDDGLLTVTGELRMPVGPIPRRMTAVRLNDARLVVFSAVSLAEDEMRRLEAVGRPAFLVVPNAYHRLDAPAWKERYPELKVVAPVGGLARVGEAVQVDTVEPDFGDPDVDFVTVPGTRRREVALVVRRPGGTTLVLNDLMAQVRGLSGFGGWMLHLMGLAGNRPQMPRTVRLLLVDDPQALRARLLDWAALPSLRRILISHGDVIENDPGRALRELADSLA